MKNFKRAFCLILIGAIICTFVFACVSCGPTPDVEKGNKNVSIVIVSADKSEKVITSNTDAEYLADLLIELRDEEKITLSYEDSQYGMNIKSLNGISVDGFNTFFASYSSDSDNTNSAWGVYTFNNVACASCAYGVSSMPIKDTHIYILEYSEYVA